MFRRPALGVFLATLLVPLMTWAEPSINANVFTHFEAYKAADESDVDDLRWGESALFVTGRLTDRLSFLTEISFEMPKYRDRPVAVERLRLRYDLNRDNWLILGKMHTPVNYWNDNFHHGRLFFPRSIDRWHLNGLFLSTRRACVLVGVTCLGPILAMTLYWVQVKAQVRLVCRGCKVIYQYVELHAFV